MSRAIFIAGIFLLTGLFSYTANSAIASELSANVSLVTDYRFRGISQGDRSMAIQGGFDVAHESGFYAGLWASNVTFSDAAIEADLYAGYSGEINGAIAYDLGYMYYAYPDDGASPDLDYQELYASISYSNLTLGLAVSDDYFAETGTFWYGYADYSLPLSNAFGLDLHIALNAFEDNENFAAFIGPARGNAGDSYIDYGITLTTQQLGLDLSLAFIGTDLSKSECFAGTKLCSDSLVLGVSKSW